MCNKLASSCPNKGLQENMLVQFTVRLEPCDRQTIIIEDYIPDIRDSDDVASCHEKIACDIFIKSVIRTSKHVAAVCSLPHSHSIQFTRRVSRVKRHTATR
jgi:hypothetical protein